MAPNAEEEMLAVKPWGIQQDKERLRPPTYNAEDYAMALRRWGRRPITSVHDPQGTLPSTTSSSSGYVSGSGEMTLRQFTSVSELLNKLRADLRLAFPSFVQEFASSPADGITLLLETLRGVQLIQSTPPSGQNGPRIGTRRAALDELGCVECLAACAERCADAPRLLSQAQPGLLALAVCLTSSLNRSRVLALQLLTKVCQTPGGHAAVSEAVSTLRLRYGEGGRFRFLAGALLAPRAAIALRVAGISFLNSFLKSAPRTQTRLYIQAEACEAGLEPRILQEWLTEVEGRCEDTLTDLLRKEVQKWSQNCVDVDALQKRLVRAEETCTILGNKVALLQDQLSKLQIEKRNGFNFSEINVESITKNQVETQRLSSNGEDEGISSSERSSSPDDLLRQNREIDNKIIDNDQETTIDDVIEELRIIVKDAEEEDRKGQENFHDTSRIISDRCTTTKLSLNQEDKIAQNADNIIKSKRDKLPNVLKHSKKIPINYGNFNVEENSTNEIDQICLPSAVSKTPADGGSLKIVVKGAADVEEAIVPAILYPQPPRRTPPCLSTILATGPDEFLEHPVIYHSHDDEDAEEETLGDGSDSLLSASRLKYNTNEQCDDLEGQLYLSKNGVTSRDQFHIDQHNERKEIKTLRNYDAGIKSINDLNQAPLCLEVYRQFESVAKSNERSRYKSEIEKKKLLRRSVSHDFLDAQNNSSLHSRKSASKVEGRIRKFESMNSFDNCSQQNLSRNSGRRRTCDNTNSRKIRRSESCHQVSHSSRKDNSSQGGSDSGLRYITDFDMEPSMVTRRLSSTEVISEPSNQLAKSLDRIDEGLDSLVDIVIGGSKDNNGHAQKISRKYPKEKDFRNFRLEDKQQSMSNNIFLEQARPSKKSSIIGLEIKNGTRGSSGNSRPRTNDHYNGIYNSSVLRNDELYQMDRVHRNHQNELNLYGKMPNFMNDINNSPFHYEKSPNKFFINDSGIFLASGKPHDAFGLGKNRFNAGKYSGNPPPTDNIGLRRNSVSKLTAKCGKVTDILSGLY
ncbi:hypothetical protein PV325_007339 [Microctonus aethiopoides]|nr:hypothetical protein PV325_007339 [Microctonus aethiopoides]KAK0173029.1 hypothetical protein PV328_006284 [Microctonus aethiopoides]